MKLPIGIHSGDHNVQTMWDQIRKWSEKQVDGDNLSDDLLGTGLEYTNSIDDPLVENSENPYKRKLQVDTDVIATVAAVAAAYQPLDSNLTELATGSTISDEAIPKGTATGGLEDSGISASQILTEAEAATTYQPLDAELTLLAAKTVPSAAGTVPIASSITANALPKFSGTTGEVVPSAVSDDGSLIIAGRATTQLGNATNAVLKTTDGATARSVTLRGSDPTSGNTGGDVTVRGGGLNGSPISGTGGAASFSGGDITGDGSTGTAGAAVFRGGDGLDGVNFDNGVNAGDAIFRGGDASQAGGGVGGDATYRAGVGNTSGVLDIQHADGTTRIKIDANGNTLFKGVQGTSGRLTAFDSTGSLTASGITEANVLTEAEAAAAYQPLDTDLTAIAALTTTAYGRAFLTEVDDASVLTNLGIAAPTTTYRNSSSQTGNVGTGDDTLRTHTIAAGKLATDLDTIEFYAAGTFATSINNKRIRVKFGATTIFDTGALAITASSSWELEGHIMRTGAATQKCAVKLNTSSAALAAYAQYATAAETLSGAVDLLITGEATDNNDVVCEMSKVFYAPAAPS